jgi:putative FmdB family regulatory protein
LPLYEYQCTKCRHRVEKIERLSGPHLAKCPKCGAKVERLAASPAIQFKGSGWYVTDYARKSSGDAGTSSQAEGEGKKEEKGQKPEKESKPSTEKAKTPVAKKD